MTELELVKARCITNEILLTVNNDRDKAVQIIHKMCKDDAQMHELFAKVGYTMYQSSQHRKH